MPKLNETDRWRVVCMIEAGVRHTDVARQFGVQTPCGDGTNSLGPPDRPRSGRPRVTSNRQDTWWFISVIDFELLF